MRVSEDSSCISQGNEGLEVSFHERAGGDEFFKVGEVASERHEHGEEGNDVEDVLPSRQDDE